MKTNKPYLGAAIVLFLFALVSPLVHAITTEPNNAACSVSAPAVVLQNPASDCVPLQLVNASFEHVSVTHVEHACPAIGIANSAGLGLNEAVSSRHSQFTQDSVAPHLDNYGNERPPAAHRGSSSHYAAPTNDTARQRLPLTG